MLYWRCAGENAPSELPTGFITLSSTFFDENLPAECLALLPSGNGSRGLLEDVVAQPEIVVDRGVGLFLNDPFLNITQIANTLKQHKIGWMTNLPSVAQHDQEFRNDLRDVGFSVQTELRNLAQLRQSGIRTMAAISSENHARMLVDYPADAVVVVQTTAELQVSFPSLSQRQARLESINYELAKHDTKLYAMALVTPAEVATQSGPVMLRPELLEH